MASVKDPVCGMEIDSEDTPAQSEFAGRTYYFCATECKEKFDADPQQFASERGESARP
ncbi:MAG TPA: YHS domain-containing protein [Pyrinomonadaceae bacterium]|nr:YHS domain-containing protein [Pyrinomonadaceae bacterium]